MPKASIDFTTLENKLLKRAYPLSQVKDQLEAVGFDLVRFKDKDKGADLWQVQSADDGDYIVALYQPDEEEKTASSWDVSLNKTASVMHVSYKGDPIISISSSALGIPASEVRSIPDYLPTKLAENKKLVKSLLGQLSQASRQAVLSKYPELG
jgi:hypothetical protein